jgi:hypothetical protein
MPAIIQRKFAKVVSLAQRKPTEPKPVAQAAADKNVAPRFLDYLRIALSGWAA